MYDKTIFITGASRGIGRATALLLDEHRYQVFAGVRSQRDADALRATASERLQPVLFDLLDPESIRAAVAHVLPQLEAHGLHLLINNAGLAVPSPVEFIPLDDLCYQFEVNVFGTIALTQTLIPALRRGQGRIINVSSIAGRVTAPMLGAYSASKFALEALTDALRLELHPWGIQVVSIQPGVIRTDFGASALQRADALLPRIPDTIHDLYGKTIAKERERATLSGQGIPPEDVAKVILKAAQARHPRTRYLVGRDARLIAFLRVLLPDALLDRLTRLMR